MGIGVFRNITMFHFTSPCFPSSPLTSSRQLSSWCWLPASPSASCPSQPLFSALGHCSPEGCQLVLMKIKVAGKPLWSSLQPSLLGHSASPSWPEQSLPPVLSVAEPSEETYFQSHHGSSRPRNTVFGPIFIGPGCLSLTHTPF